MKRKIESKLSVKRSFVFLMSVGAFWMTSSNHTLISKDNVTTGDLATGTFLVNDSRDNAKEGINSQSDLEITQKIRKTIISDSTLSSYAHNVQIIVENGHVTLTGLVRSNEELSKVVNIAKNVAGVNNVHNEIKLVHNNRKENSNKM